MDRGEEISPVEDDGEIISDQELTIAESVIDADRLLKCTSILASDEFGGRFPGTEDEARTLAYLEAEAIQIGCIPGNRAESSFKQSVPLVKATPIEVSGIRIETDGPELATRQDCMIWTSRIEEDVEIDESELIFVGYGITAPHQDWDDYADLDWAGKTVVCLVNDPGFASNDESLFNGRAMTYYGRWTYKRIQTRGPGQRPGPGAKFEEAGRRGAAGCLIVHNTAAASYPWHVIENGRGTPGKPFYLIESGHKHKTEIEGWITESAADHLFKRAGLDFEEMKALAHQRGFKPVPLKQWCRMRVKQRFERLVSHNFVAMIEGTHPTLKEEFVVFTAHWDHLGRQGTEIYRGARDNALGCAAILECARAIKKLPEHKRRRSTLVLLTTCEEQILLGSLHYVSAPLVPLRKTIACLNVDVMATFGRTKDMSYSGLGFSEIDVLVERAAARQNRVVTGEHTPETGTFYRSDHFPFAKHGVPAMYLKNGFDHVDKGYKWLYELYQQWIVDCYHKPDDKVVAGPGHKFSWDLSGAVEDTRLLFHVACQMIDNGRYIHWKDGAEFKHIRTAHLKEGIHVPPPHQ